MPHGTRALPLTLAAWAATAAWVCLAGDLRGDEPSTLSFSRDVRPILADRCFACHGPDAATREAGLRLDDPESAIHGSGGTPAVVPGDATASEMIVRIEQDDPDLRMPPAGSGKRLSKADIDILRQWIDEGAAYERHWAFEPPKRPTAPSVNDESWPRNAIDRFVLARLEGAGMLPAEAAERSTWLRRVTLDLTGLPPTTRELDAFLADRSPQADRRVIDRLMHSERYGEAMAATWLDAARYADTDGYQNDGPREMWAWRDWVVNAFNAGMTYDRFTIEQLAGDLLPGATHEQRIATGFNRNHRYNSEAGLVLEEFLLENAVDRVDTTSTVWMGLTIGCARCHDHKFDPVSIREYYQLVSFFDSIGESGRAIKFGNSEPWVKAPTRAEAADRERRDGQIADIRRRLAESTGEIDDQVETWVAAIGTARDPSLSGITPPVPQQLRHHLSFDAAAGPTAAATPDADDWRSAVGEGVIGDGLWLDGERSLSLGPIAEARCEKRFSLSFWIRPGRTDRGVILSRQEDNTRRPGLAVELHDGKLRFFIITRWVAGVGAVETVAPVAEDRWTHVVLTNDGTQRAAGMRIYINGSRADTRVLFNTNSNTGGTPPKSTLRVGGGVHGKRYRGGLDEFRHYDRTLWPDEVARLAEEPRWREMAGRPADGRTAAERRWLRQWYLEQPGDEPQRRLSRRWHEARLERQRAWDRVATTMVMRQVPRDAPTRVRNRGVYDQLGEAVAPAVPAILPPLEAGPPADRLALARWLVGDEHPLTARVAVNREWQRFFGRGLVATPEDFGLQGGSPSHPELLDWLATELVRSGWNLRHIQRLIVSSQTYRQSSRVGPEARETDPENRLLARGPRLRLSAQTIRDQALAVAGLLSNRLGGPSVKTLQPDGLWEEMSNMTYQAGRGEDLVRRSLYTYWKRTVAPPSLATLDAADRESCSVRGRRTNTPLQALTLLNEPTFVSAAGGMARRLYRRWGDAETGRLDVEAVASDAFRGVTSRPPAPDERRALVSALTAYLEHYRDDPAAAERLLRTVDVLGTGGPSRPADRSSPPADLAALSVFANMLLNLDETITKE